MVREALLMIADIAEGSTTPNSLPHIAKIARETVAQLNGPQANAETRASDSGEKK